MGDTGQRRRRDRPGVTTEEVEEIRRLKAENEYPTVETPPPAPVLEPTVTRPAMSEVVVAITAISRRLRSRMPVSAGSHEPLKSGDEGQVLRLEVLLI